MFVKVSCLPSLFSFSVRGSIVGSFFEEAFWFLVLLLFWAGFVFYVSAAFLQICSCMRVFFSSRSSTCFYSLWNRSSNLWRWLQTHPLHFEHLGTFILAFIGSWIGAGTYSYALIKSSKADKSSSSSLCSFKLSEVYPCCSIGCSGALGLLIFD